MKPSPMIAGVMITQAVQAAYESGMSRDMVVNSAGKLYDAFSTNQSPEVLVESLLELVSPDHREMIREQLKKMGLDK